MKKFAKLGSLALAIALICALLTGCGDGVSLKVVLKHVTASAADREYGYLTTALTDTILFSEHDQ